MQHIVLEFFLSNLQFSQLNLHCDATRLCGMQLEHKQVHARIFIGP